MQRGELRAGFLYLLGFSYGFLSSSFRSTNHFQEIAKRFACCMCHQDLIDEDECYVVSWLHIENPYSVYPSSKLWGGGGYETFKPLHPPRPLKNRFVQTCQLWLLSARLVQSTQPMMSQALLNRRQPQRQRHQHRSYPKNSCIRPEIPLVMKQQ